MDPVRLALRLKNKTKSGWMTERLIEIQAWKVSIERIIIVCIVWWWASTSKFVFEQLKCNFSSHWYLYQHSISTKTMPFIKKIIFNLKNWLILKINSMLLFVYVCQCLRVKKEIFTIFPWYNMFCNNFIIIRFQRVLMYPNAKNAFKNV